MKSSSAISKFYSSSPSQSFESILLRRAGLAEDYAEDLAPKPTFYPRVDGGKRPKYFAQLHSSTLQLKKDIETSYFQEDRFKPVRDEEGRLIIPPPFADGWKISNRVTTSTVGLVSCLNIGVDVPDCPKIAPCATLECWVDPSANTPDKALSAIGRALEKQFRAHQSKAEVQFHTCMDATVPDMCNLLKTLRGSAGTDRVLLYYNGHGVPSPEKGPLNDPTPEGAQLWFVAHIITE